MPKVTDQIKIKAEWDGQPVDRGLKNITDDLNRIERNAKEAATATGKMGGSFGKLQSEVSGVLSKLGPIGPAIAGAFGAAAIAQVGRLAHEVALLANQFDLTSDAFDRLARRAGSTAPAELEKLRNAVGGTLSDLRLMQSVGAAVDAGLTFEQSRTAVEFLRRYSLAFGKDFNQLTSTIFTGLQRGSTLMLDDAGIIIDASSDIYKGLSEVEKKSALVETAIQLMGEKMKTLPAITDNVITSTGQLASAWENLRIEMGKFFEEDTNGVLRGLVWSLNLLHDILKKNREETEKLQKAVKDMQQNEAQNLGAVGRYFGLDQDRVLGGALREDPFDAADRFRLDWIEKKLDEALTRATQKLFDGDGTSLLSEKFNATLEIHHDRLIRVSDAMTVTFNAAEAAARYVQQVQSYRVIDLDLDRLMSSLHGGLTVKEQQKILDAISELPKALKLAAKAAANSPPISLPTPTPKNETDLERHLRELKQLDNNLGLLATSLSRVSSEAGTAVGGIGLVVSSLHRLNTTTSVIGTLGASVGVFGGVAAAVGGAIGLVTSLFGSGKSAAEEYAERQRAAEEATRRTAEALRQFENAVQEKSLRDLRGLKTLYEQVLKINTSNPIGRDIKAYQSTYAQLDAVNAQIARFGGALNTVGEAFQRYQHLVNIRNITDPTEKMTLFVEQLNALGQRVQNGGLFAYIDKEGEERALGDFYRSLKAGNATLEDLYARTEQYNFQDRRRIIEHLAQLERNIRQEQADVMIAQIEKQRRDVLEALSNAEEAQRRAALRAVELQFDFAEAELRARYQPLFAGAGGDRAQLSVLRESALRDIETLRARESGATESILNQISKNFSTERDRQTTLYDQTAKAIRDAVPDLSKPFADAIEAQMSALISAWEADPTGASLTVALPPAVESTLSKVLEWADSQLDIPDPPKLPVLPEDFWTPYPVLPEDFWTPYPALPEDFWTPYPALPPWQPYLDMPPWPEYSPFNWPPNYPTFAWPAYPPLPPWSPYSPLPPWPDYSPFAWPEYPHPDPLPLAIPDGGLPLAIPDGGLPVAVDSIETPPPVIMSPGIDTEQLKSELLNEILQRLQENSPLRRYVINADGDIVDIGIGTG